MTKIRALLLALALAASQALADPLTDMQMQHDILAWHLSQGETPETACSVIASYYPGYECRAVGADYIISRGHNLETTYLVTITLPEKAQ